MTPEEYVQALRAPFPLDAHEVREGSMRNKVQWFVYITREAIQGRLDHLFPMQWSVTYPQMADAGSVAVATCRIVIGDLFRESNGMAGGDNKDEGNNAKAAATDAFKRAASMWGIGLYLQGTPQIWTDGGYKTERGIDFPKRNAQEKEALAKFRDWYLQMYDKPVPGWANELSIGELLARLKKRGYNVTTQEMADAVGIAEHTNYAAWNAKFTDRSKAGQAIWDYFGNHPELKKE